MTYGLFWALSSQQPIMKHTVYILWKNVSKKPSCGFLLVTYENYLCIDVEACGWPAWHLLFSPLSLKGHDNKTFFSFSVCDPIWKYERFSNFVFIFHGYSDLKIIFKNRLLRKSNSNAMQNTVSYQTWTFKHIIVNVLY